MNKLISRNPVLRFKLGRKIIKAQHSWGSDFGVVPTASYYTSLSENRDRKRREEELNKVIAESKYREITPQELGRYNRTNKPLYRIQVPFKQAKYSSYLGRDLSDMNFYPYYDDDYSKVSGFVLDLDLNVRNNTNSALKLANYIASSITSGGEYALLLIPYDTERSYGATNTKVSVNKKDEGKPEVKTNTKLKQKSSIPTTVFAGHKIGRTGGLNYNISDTDKLQLIGTGQFTESDFTNAMATQLALNRYFVNSGLGSVKEDGAWGDLSRAALALALSKSKSVTPFNNETTVVKTPITPTYTPPTTPINLEIANLKLNVPTYYNANRSQTRDWMRSNGINPYSVTGAMRAAVRRMRAGQADDNDKLLVKGNEQLYNLLKGYYKKGGQLPSRNVVKRFKQKNFR